MPQNEDSIDTFLTVFFILSYIEASPLFCSNSDDIALTCIDSYIGHMIQIVVITTFIKMCFSHTYIGQADFIGITQANAKPIIFMNRQPTATISINITDDNLVEGREHFMVHIISGGNVLDLTVFAPNATVNIEDNDGEYHYCINDIIFLLFNAAS